MSIDCYYTEKTKVSINHDLNFLKNLYETVHPVTFKNPSQVLQEKLRELGPLPNDDDARPKKKGTASKKSTQKYDYEKIAEAMERLEEEDLLKVIQIIHDYKSADTYIKSDIDGKRPSRIAFVGPFFCLTWMLWCIHSFSELIVDNLLEAGEFSIDLYTMPEILTKMLWDHLVRTLSRSRLKFLPLGEGGGRRNAHD
jgi:transcription initiation factor TFIID/TFIIF subunit